MRILWLNWRDVSHPLAGGAEVYTHEIARRLAAWGHEVVLITSRPGGSPAEEFIDGYRVLRAGGRYTVYLRAREIYRRLRSQGWAPDVVVDEVNTVPFFTPLYVGEPIAVLIHQLCRECWRYAIHPLAEPLGWALERGFHRIYVESARRGRVRAVVTVSPSTGRDLVELGYPWDMIYIVYNGIDWELYKGCGELGGEKQDLAVYVGRITPYKRLEDLIRAWSIVEQEERSARLVIAGRAEPRYLEKLQSLARRSGLERVEFRTNISLQEKMLLLARAKVLVYTSAREGWGQAVLEAAACRTPAVAYNVPGLRDSVKHMETGILVEPGDTEQLARALTWLLTDNNLRDKLAENAYEYAQSFNWDGTAANFLKVIGKVVDR